MNQIEQILAIKNTLGEGPIWHPQEQVLYWVDIDGHCFFKFDPLTRKYQRFEVGLPIGTIAFRAEGGLIMATQKGLLFGMRRPLQRNSLLIQKPKNPKHALMMAK
jgi:sugar lactone lactonase YvrE